MTDIEPGQMSIFDVLEEETAPIPVKLEPTELKTQTPGTIRINEYHFDSKYSSREFIDWAKNTGREIGDLFTIAEVNGYHKSKGTD